MFTINDKKYLNLPEKVEANAEDISDLKTSLDTKQDTGTAVNDTNLKNKVEALDTLALKSVSTAELTNSGNITNSGDLTNAGNITNTGTLDQEGKATFGGDVEVDGSVTLNSPTDVKFKTGSLDFSELTDFMTQYYATVYQYKFAGASITGAEEGFGESFNPSYSLKDFHKATDLRGLFSRANVRDISSITLPDMDIVANHYMYMIDLAAEATADRDFTITLGSGLYNFAYMFRWDGAETTFVQHMKKFLVADGKTAYVSDMQHAFAGCTGLEEVGAFDLSNLNGAGHMQSAFKYAKSLKSIHCTHFKASFDISASTAFEEADLVEIIGNLDTVTTAQTLTMGATNLAKLTQDEILVATGKGWTLA